MCNVNGRKFQRDASVATSPGQHKSANSVEVLHLQISSDWRRLTSALVLKSLWSVHLHVSSTIQTCWDRRPLAPKLVGMPILQLSSQLTKPLAIFKMTPIFNAGHLIRNMWHDPRKSFGNGWIFRWFFKTMQSWNGGNIPWGKSF